MIVKQSERTFCFMSRILAHWGNIFVSSDDEDATANMANVIADQFTRTWPIDHDEMTPLFVDLTGPNGKVRYMVTPTDTLAEGGLLQ